MNLMQRTILWFSATTSHLLLEICDVIHFTRYSLLNVNLISIGGLMCMQKMAAKKKTYFVVTVD